MKIEHPIQETEVTVIGENVSIEGRTKLDGVVRIYGKLKGEVEAPPHSQIILMESALIEGHLTVDTIVIAGFVRGNITAHNRVSIEGTGRVIGNIESPTIKIDFGAYLEGETKMPHPKKKPKTDLSPSTSESF